MRDYTNLQWPEAPFGAEQRPYGRHADLLAAFTLDWRPQPHGPQLAAAATVYLRLVRHGRTCDVDADLLPIGFRATVVDDPADRADLLALVDRALIRARRHATILAGHDLGAGLDRMLAGSPVPLRGAEGLRRDWAHREVRQRGIAVMVDTVDVPVGITLDTPVAPPAAGRDSSAGAVDLARCALTRCLAVGLAAAAHTGRYRWNGTFPVGVAVERVSWDLLTPAETPAVSSVTGVRD